MKNEPAVSTRYLRSQQEKQAYNAVETESGAGGGKYIVHISLKSIVFWSSFIFYNFL